MTSNNRLLPLLCAIAVSLGAASAEGTLMKATTFDEKVDNADAIVLGKCVRTESKWDDGRRVILTYSTFRIEKAMKGNAAGEITIVTPGGQVGTIQQASIGIPVFQAGDEKVIFVRNTRLGPTVLYFDQGTYDVVSDGKERVVQPVPTGAVFVDTQRGVAVEGERPRALREFEREVRDAGDRVRAQKMELIREREKQASIWSILLKYKALVGLALAGAAIATWQLLRR